MTVHQDYEIKINLNELNNEAFDLKTYKKFLSFLKFQEMTEKYDT